MRHNAPPIQPTVAAGARRERDDTAAFDENTTRRQYGGNPFRYNRQPHATYTPKPLAAPRVNNAYVEQRSRLEQIGLARPIVRSALVTQHAFNQAGHCVHGCGVKETDICCCVGLGRFADTAPVPPPLPVHTVPAADTVAAPVQEPSIAPTVATE